MMEQVEPKAFQKIVYTYYRTSGRHDLPWRPPALELSEGILDPYAIAVSEVMLQQTQVSRVSEKFRAFMSRFPNIEALANAPLRDVLVLWSGLGYNRRAKFLKQMAETILEKHKGVFPHTKEELLSLPGIGAYTAGAIRAFAYNKPDVFIETNIRTVYIHHFLNKKKVVTDAMIADMVTQTIDRKNPRMWYWALMDYGAYLKQNGNVVHRKSKHYVKQSAFKGSRRQVRGAVLRALIEKPRTSQELVSSTTFDTGIVLSVLDDLSKEGLIQKKKLKFSLIA